MTMKINSFGLERYKSIANAAPKQEAAAKPRQTGALPEGNTDKVAFSGEASFKAELVRQVQAQSQDVEGAAQERLEALTCQIQQGTYAVDAFALAGNILDKLT